GTVPSGAGSIGAAHLALTVKDIHVAIARVEAAGWKAKGNPLPIPGGPRKGTLVAYVSGPDHITIELMQPTAS
ncbi:VOC family protein, partial [Sphingomonas sp. Leaf38]